MSLGIHKPIMLNMIHNNTFRIVACAIACSFCYPSMADTTVQLKPKLCVKKRVTDFCDVSVDIQWQANNTNKHCVVNKTQNKSVDCWPDSTAGTTSDQAHTKVDLVYALLNSAGGDPLATQTLNVLSLKDDSKNNSRRRRHIWSLF